MTPITYSHCAGQIKDTVKEFFLRKKEDFLETIFTDDAPGLRFNDVIWNSEALMFAEFLLRDLTIPRWQKQAARHAEKLEKDMAKAEATHEGE